MTNEELAAQAKAGDKAALGQLWEQNRGLLAKLFGALVDKAGARMAAAGVTREDVEQSYFLAVALAVQRYEPERGVRFASCLSYPVKQVFFDLIGLRTKHQRCDPLGQSISLDETVRGADGSETPRGALVPDEAAAWMLESAERALFCEQLHAALEECLATLEAAQAEAVRCRYIEQRSLTDTGAQLGCTAEQARTLAYNGMKKLRSPRNVQRLEQYRHQVITEGAYHGTGWAAWKRGGSVEERVVLRLADKGLLEM